MPKVKNEGRIYAIMTRCGYGYWEGEIDHMRYSVDANIDMLKLVGKKIRITWKRRKGKLDPKSIMIYVGDNLENKLTNVLSFKYTLDASDSFGKAVFTTLGDPKIRKNCKECFVFR